MLEIRSSVVPEQFQQVCMQNRRLGPMSKLHGTDIAPDEQELFDTSSGGFGGDETGAMSDPE